MQQGGHPKRNIHRRNLRNKRKQPQRLALAFNGGIISKPKYTNSKHKVLGAPKGRIPGG